MELSYAVHFIIVDGLADLQLWWYLKPVHSSVCFCFDLLQCLALSFLLFVYMRLYTYTQGDDMCIPINIYKKGWQEHTLFLHV